MDDRARNSCSHNYSKSVVFPRIKTDRRDASERDPRRNQSDRQSLEDQILGDRRSLRSKSPRTYGHGRSSGFVKHVLEKLEFTERALEEERLDRSLLEDHLRGVVANVQRLSKDMAMLQHQIKSDEDNAQSQCLAMKNLEMHQVSGIGDVWNRLTLGDLNSNKLSCDLNKVGTEVSDLKKNEEELKRRLNKLQSVVDGLITRIEKLNMEFEKIIQILKDKIENTQNRYEGMSNVNYLDNKVEEYCSKILSKVEHRLDISIGIQKSREEAIERRIGQLEEKVAEVMEMKGRKDEDLFRKIQEASTNQTEAFQKSHQKLKDSYQEAFSAVYESITIMQAVLEAKLKLIEADLKTSINNILKTIAHC